jgi:hypothetical protein
MIRRESALLHPLPLSGLQFQLKIRASIMVQDLGIKADFRVTALIVN